MKNTNNIESGVLGLGTSIQPSQIACSKSATLTRLPSVSHHRPQYYVLLFIPEPLLLVNTILFKPVLIILAETGLYNGSYSSLGVGTSLKRDIMFLSPIENSVSKDFNGHEERWIKEQNSLCGQLVLSLPNKVNDSSAGTKGEYGK